MRYLDIMLSSLDNNYFIVGTFDDYMLINQLELIPEDEYETYINEYIIPQMRIEYIHTEDDKYDLTGGCNIEVSIIENNVSKYICKYQSDISLEEIYNRQIYMNRGELHKVELPTGGFAYLDEEAWKHFEGQFNHRNITTTFQETKLTFIRK